jgi:nitrite reductase/ring-hydroxylating ferredoxin subunit
MALRVMRSADLADGQRISRVRVDKRTAPSLRGALLRASTLPAQRPAAQSVCDGCVLPQAVHGRTVTVLRHNGQVHCLDALCYHMGAPRRRPAPAELRAQAPDMAGDAAHVTRHVCTRQGARWGTRVTSKTYRPAALASGAPGTGTGCGGPGALLSS